MIGITWYFYFISLSLNDICVSYYVGIGVAVGCGSSCSSFRGI
jgi:hypothetical protein